MLILTPAFAGGSFASTKTVSVDLTGANALIVRVVNTGITTPGGTPITSCVIDPTGANIAMTGDTAVSAYTNGLERTFTYLGSLPSGVIDVVVTLADGNGKPQVWAQPIADCTAIGTAVRTSAGGSTATSPSVTSIAGATVLSMSASNNYSDANTITPTPPTVVERRVLTTDGGGSMTAVGVIASTPSSGSTTSVALTGPSTFGTWSMYSWLLTPDADLVAPTLTSPTGTKTGGTTATGTVSTNEANGTLYRLTSINATETAATVKAAGLMTTVTATGTQSVSFTGLVASTTYYAHYVHRDAAGNDSARVSSASFTTDPESDTTAPTLSGTITVSALTSTSYTATCPIATDNVAVTGYQYRINAGSWVSIAGGGRAANITGRTASTTDTLEMRATDAAGNFSSALTASVNLPAIATYSVSAGPCYFNTNSGPQLSVSVTWSLIYANVGGYSGATIVDGSGTLHASTGLLAISGLAASGAADLYIKDSAGGIYYQRATAA